jgi:nucleotide-binding universal stress UspA family protein
MMRSLLVPATGTQADLTALTTALKIARDFSAHIDVLHVRLDAVDVAVKTTSGQGGPLVEHLIQQLEQDAHERETRARRTFEDFCTRENVRLVDAPGCEPAVSPSAQWHVETGDEPDMVVSHGMLADLVICARSPDNHFTTRLILERALLNTGRPLLIPSAVGTPPDFGGGTVAIAWKPTPEAARAVTAAMPLLALAKDVVVMTVDEEDSLWQMDGLVRNLAWHGLRASTESLALKGRDPAKTLLDAAEKKASLLVMGGYGHSRIREWVFGGFTRQILADAPLPVFMAH